MNTPHTPGPWVSMAIYTKGKLTHWGINGASENGSTLTTGRIVDVHRHVPNHDGPTQESNARLIAAAPELLQACEALLEAYAPNANMSAFQCLHSSVKKAITAIGKAKGTVCQNVTEKQ